VAFLEMISEKEQTNGFVFQKIFSRSNQVIKTNRKYQ